MQPFLINTLSNLALLICFLGLLEIPVQFNYEKQNSDDANWHTLGDIDATAVFIGNSRCLTTFNTPLIQQLTGLKAFNIAQNSYKAKFIYSKAKHYKRQNIDPMLVFIQCDRSMVGEQKEWYRKVDFLKYMFLDRENIKSEFTHLEGYEELEWWIPTIRYGSFPDRYLNDAFGNYIGTPNYELGYSLRLPNTNKTLPEIPTDTLLTDFNSLNYIDSIALLFPSSHIILIQPPYSKKLCKINNNQGADSLALQRNWTLLDFAKIDFPDSTFDNNTHVNCWGSQLVSDSISEYINSIKDALQQP